MYKEYELMIKPVQEQCIQPTMKFLLGFNIKMELSLREGELTFGGGIKIWWEESTGGDFSWWGRDE